MFGVGVERLTGAMPDQRIAERAGPAERRVERDHVLFGAFDPAGDRRRCRLAGGAESDALELELAAVVDHPVRKPGTCLLCRAIDADNRKRHARSFDQLRRSARLRHALESFEPPLKPLQAPYMGLVA